MAITQAIANSFKQELLEGEHDFKTPGGDVFKLALYTSAATLDSSTTVYTSTNEVANTGTYSAGGGTLVNSGTSQKLVELHFAILQICHLQVLH
jgi:hypothetical protein